LTRARLWSNFTVITVIKKLRGGCQKNKMESLFWGSSSMDLNITFFLLAVSLIISLVVLIVAKRKILSLVIFSILGNLVFLLGAFTHSEMFRAYGIIWFEIFSLFIWPILNIFLIIYYAKTKPKK